MSKKDIPILVALLALWILWPGIDRQIKKRFYPESPTTVTETAEPVPVAEPATTRPVTTADAPVSPDGQAEPASLEAPAASVEVPAEEKLVTLENDVMSVTFSSRGASVKEVVVKDYRLTVEENSGPVILDFSLRPSLTYQGMPEFDANTSFKMTSSRAAKTVKFKKMGGQGLKFTRTIALKENYLLEVRDEWEADGEPVTLPTHTLQLGPMQNLPGERIKPGMVFLGVDALMTGGDGVKHWGSKIPRWFEKRGPNEVEKDLSARADWVAVKNRFFTQILSNADGFSSVHGHAIRDGATRKVELVSGQGELPGVVVESGAPLVLDMQYFVGPKKLSDLKAMGLHTNKVMELGWFAFFGRFLLVVMNFIHEKMWPYNYGVAIMLLTIIIRTLFWPLTHKGTESMKKLQHLQPLMKEIQAKYKAADSDSDKVKREKMQKQQKAMMGLYKEHKVNPMMGCLPMLVQIPVFISLFYVLRSAIELRFADFLWVADLSEAERIFQFGFSIPLLGWDAFNVLPLLMVATTFVQQKLTPTTGDPTQRKIMMMMPIMMLFFLYEFAAGLMLYWTTNNAIMIVQQWWQRRTSETFAEPAAPAKA